MVPLSQNCLKTLHSFPKPPDSCFYCLSNEFNERYDIMGDQGQYIFLTSSYCACRVHMKPPEMKTEDTPLIRV